VIGIVTSTPLYQMTALVLGALIILIGVSMPYRLEKKIRKGRAISFQNPDGEVTISLSAVEDYVHKIAKSITGIKDVKSRVNAGKKGINVVTDVSIAASANIPEVTERIQMEVKNKVQSMLGVEEGVNIRLNIKKIAKGPKTAEGLQKEDVPAAQENVPYR
ncbi:MAG: alkaline shock response membrane anchor protein AmaP, partial [Candidatus Omnitrophica bacterium]|nr:alkaline shock response membrane anchor protein AmaP [Candidatus Omnitrophota bacterium]